MLPVEGPYPPHRILGWASEEYARQLLRERRVWGRGNKRKIQSLRYISIKGSADDEIEHQVPVRTRGIAAPHKRETPVNPPGVWTFDYLPKWAREKVFRSVIESCKAA